MADRAARIAALAVELAPAPSATLDRAAQLVKFDLGAQLVTEMTSLAGVLAQDYALHAGETPAVALAVYEAELPRFTGDDLPTTLPGALLSLTDRFDLVVGLAATVGLPTGSSDPFAVRRAVLGLLAVHRAHPGLAGIALSDGFAAAAARQPVEVTPEVLAAIGEFVAGRFEQVLIEEGQPVDWVRAAAPHFDRPSVADRVLFELSTLVGEDTFEGVAGAILRARRIVPAGTLPAYDQTVLIEPAEIALHEAVTAVVAQSELVRFVSAASGIVEPVGRFFDEVFVMADDPALRAARLGLLATVRDLGAGLLDWRHLHP
jgi:glycyl-tRNA synthetase